jgi:GNAT superfamily N-acetyltransferase
MEAFDSMKDIMEQIYFIERLAVNTWPAEYTETIGDWILRASGGITKRANSVFTWRDFPADKDWLPHAEDFYKHHGLPARFHISDASPPALDPMLEQLGYEKQVLCMVMIADCEEVCRLSKHRWELKHKLDVEQLWLTSANKAWLDDFLRFEQFTEDRSSFYSGLMDRMGQIKGHVQLMDNGRNVAVGTAMAENGWAGFVNVVVDETYRGQGIGYRLMQALAGWSLEQGAKNLYLQVIADNDSAVRLYTNIGFTPLYRYHYRCKV